MVLSIHISGIVRQLNLASIPFETWCIDSACDLDPADYQITLWYRATPLALPLCAHSTGYALRFPTMHHIFSISEIVRSILTPQVDKRTLYAAARTCRALQELSLDALWCELDSIVPLITLVGDLHWVSEVVYHSRYNQSTNFMVSTCASSSLHNLPTWPHSGSSWGPGLRTNSGIRSKSTIKEWKDLSWAHNSQNPGRLLLYQLQSSPLLPLPFLMVSKFCLISHRST